jgi:hypothetical protein
MPEDARQYWGFSFNLRSNHRQPNVNIILVRIGDGHTRCAKPSLVGYSMFRPQEYKLFFLPMKNAEPCAMESFVRLIANVDAVIEASVNKEALNIYSVYRALIAARDRAPRVRRQSKPY